MRNNEEIKYENKPMKDMSEQEIAACSDLFGSSYGKYDKESPVRPGQPIRMGIEQYKKRYCAPGVFLVRAMDDNRQVGHALYIRKEYKPYGTITWVVQLVVDKDFRRRGIASRLLRSIWGFSNDFAWGLASANPCTVKTLESVTFRKCKWRYICKNIDAIKAIGADTSFVSDDAYDVDEGISQVNTRFFADNSEFIKEMDYERELGRLKPGHEWLAFTFREQPIDRRSFNRHFGRMMIDHANITKDAYRRMRIDEHPWAKGYENEIRFLEMYCQEGNILDLGCGTGRHAVGLAKRGYTVTAIDNVSEHLNIARNKCEKMKNIRFVCDDVRRFKDNQCYDMVICLYDVIGSYAHKNDNIRILNTAFKHLKPKGIFVLSVMNMELTESIIPKEKRGAIQSNPEILLELPPANIMQSTGQIFDGNYLALDTERYLVYRKEQFYGDRSLPAEYIIRDKRYYGTEIKEMLEKVGFAIKDIRYVQAGHFDKPLEPLDIRAKEICVVCEK